uniref:hypothetical protein n=1 Tax=Okeania sp. SIO2F4 TaxID=2607790 RepID=UPI0025E517C6|nr:hypothetical protein [Okeania sp. SIO2F4]
MPHNHHHHYHRHYRHQDLLVQNPLWLKSVASQIQELQENLIELLPDDTILLPEDLKDILQEQFKRLSETEKQTLSLLATKNQPISLAQLLETAQIQLSNLLKTLQSLCRHCFIEKQGNLYSVPPVLTGQMNFLFFSSTIVQ